MGVVNTEPIELAHVFDSFDELWSPRIATTVNDYDVRVAKIQGEHVWHTHDDTDEFFLVVDGTLRLALRTPEGEREVVMPPGSVFTVPAGVEHKPSSAEGARILMLEPSGTPTTGDRHDDLPEHIRTSTGQAYRG
jgi:mannose-6-phosphate isomerase-like protein (cupin superfamily)